MFVYFSNILNKTTLTKENRSLQSNYKNPVKKATPFFAFMERFQLPHDQVLVLVDRTLS